MKNKRSLNINDYWQWYYKHKPKGKEYILTEKQHNDIIRAVFTAIKEYLLKGETVSLGTQLGTLCMYKYTYDNWFYVDKNGKAHDRRPVDWEIVNKKRRGELPKETSVRWTKPIAIVVWNKRYAHIKNKCYLKFHPNSGFMSTITKYYKNHEIDLPKWEKSNYCNSISRIWRAV